ncbi:N-acetylglucosaminyl transferase component-domain-containing protein, partial [Cladochytrium replicatum]
MALRVFWPGHWERTFEEGTRYLGWVNRSSNTVCMAAVLRASQLHLVDRVRSGWFEGWFGLESPRVFGRCDADGSENEAGEEDFIVAVSRQDSHIISIRFCGRIIKNLEIIGFKQPRSHRLQYYSLTALQLDLREAQREQAGPKSAEGSESGLHIVLKQINVSIFVERMLVPRSVKFRAFQWWDDLPPNLAHQNPRHRILQTPFVKPFLFIVAFLRILIEVLLDLLESPALDTTIVNIFTAAQQMHLRLQQGAFWPSQYIQWKLNDRKLSPLCQAQYIGFYNTVWLIANDIIVGVAVGQLLMSNSERISTYCFNFLHEYTITFIRVTVSWLMSWPAGLKLNSELGSFLASLFLWLTDSWESILSAAQPYIPRLIHAIGVSGYLGTSMILALSSDLLSISTLHLHIFYTVSGRIYYWQVSCIHSLFMLFQGKKHNVLRNRIDSAVYGIDQLLLGTLMFTLLIFLFPTVGVFYLFFTLCRVVVVGLQASADILLAAINHFPLFALMQLVKDPARLPAGISMSVVGTTKTRNVLGKGVTVLELEMKSKPVSLSSILYQYGYLLQSVQKQYLSLSILRDVLVGKPILRNSNLQYPTLPPRQHRASYTDLWNSIISFSK